MSTIHYQQITYVVDESTGEVIEINENEPLDPELACSPEQAEHIERMAAINERMHPKKYPELRPSKEYYEDLYRRLKERAGPFVWVKFDPMQPFFPDIDPATLMRTFYVGSYTSGFGRCHLENLCLGKGTSAAKADMLATGLFNEEVDQENISRDVMWKGPMGTDCGTGVGKLFRFPFQWAVENVDTSAHNTIGQILKLIPYAHQTTNIIHKGFNDHKELIPMKASDIADVLGLTREHGARTVEQMMEIKFSKDARVRPLFYQSWYKGKKVYCIHPDVWYSGNILKQEHLKVPKWYLL